MNDKLILRLIESSHKECEVTGRDMGGESCYETPFSNITTGMVRWPQKSTPDHIVNINEIGKDHIVLTVRTIPGTVSHPITLRSGDTYDYGWYSFGEWSYSYKVSLSELTAEQLKYYGPESAFRKARKCEESLLREDGKIDNSAYLETKSAYESAARLGSSEAYSWLVKDALTHIRTYRGEQLWTYPAYTSQALDILLEAEAKSLGAPARAIFEERPDFYIEDGILYDVLREYSEIIIPDGVTEISGHCFSRAAIRCEQPLETVIIPQSVKTIGERAFLNLDNLKYVEIEGSVTIGEYAFASCSKLEEVVIKGRANIGNNAFSNCTSLKRVTLAKGSKYNYEKVFGTKFKVTEIIEN